VVQARLTVGRFGQDPRVRRIATLTLAAALLAGCGDDKPVDLPEEDGKKPAQEALSYRGTTSQRERFTMRVEDRVRATLPLALRCRDGSRTEATLATEPDSPQLEADGSFYYSETGRSEFRGLGTGRYRAAVQGQVQGNTGEGNASFRITFRSTSCRANVSWRVRRASAR